ncbi:hypothetical protein AAFF_G00259680 [Aldrovandia affinis]|uniref:Uncharacterized protein n=1 Tax=Aldrovandia affinis TaxID=143900 RepID=A0AAD7RCF1_9TELE|nr:hypothetical protein AAFF_G00259680 [Aldrovandia affinis]
MLARHSGTRRQRNAAPEHRDEFYHREQTGGSAADVERTREDSMPDWLIYSEAPLGWRNCPSFALRPLGNPPNWTPQLSHTEERGFVYVRPAGLSRSSSPDPFTVYQKNPRKASRVV